MLSNLYISLSVQIYRLVFYYLIYLCMDVPTPPNNSPQKIPGSRITTKIITIAVLIFVCYIPILFIQGLIADRTYYQEIALENDQQTNVSISTTKREQQLADYRAITRVTKYAILFITLTFALFFLFEVLSNIKIHPINYGLVGLAIAIFYLLLLSFAELIGFIPAYLLAASAVVGLITTYITHTLKSLKKVGLLGTLLVSLYAYLMVLLQLEAYSLLFGSLLVFATLASIMVSTRKIDWYNV